jgi:glucose-1-phosphate adenylyltransferase
MIKYHQEKEADLTIATMHVPLNEANRFGIMTVNAENRIVRFHEKRSNRKVPWLLWAYMCSTPRC